MLKFTQLARGSCSPNPGLYDLIFFSFQNLPQGHSRKRSLSGKVMAFWDRMVSWRKCRPVSPVCSSGKGEMCYKEIKLKYCLIFHSL